MIYICRNDKTALMMIVMMTSNHERRDLPAGAVEHC